LNWAKFVDHHVGLLGARCPDLLGVTRLGVARYLEFFSDIGLGGYEVRALRNADMVLLALLAPSTVAILMVCLSGLAGLSTQWNGDVLGQLLLFRAGVAHTLSTESSTDIDTRSNWQKPGCTSGTL
jgi:hypothetical protein